MKTVVMSENCRTHPQSIFSSTTSVQYGGKLILDIPTIYPALCTLNDVQKNIGKGGGWLSRCALGFLFIAAKMEKSIGRHSTPRRI